jgi:hypothetical protein
MSPQRALFIVINRVASRFNRIGCVANALFNVKIAQKGGNQPVESQAFEWARLTL